jgi:serine/threonine-protein kinase
VGVYDCGFEQGVHYMAMEYVDGGTLHGAMKRFGRLPWEQATRLVLQVARGVEHAHGLGIIHRDIKPANILIGRDGSAKLSDLGLAKQIEEDSLSFQPGLTMHGVVLGSPAYMSPEQIRSSKDVVPQSDIYALGATLFQMITGELPHEGSLPIEVMNAVLTKDHRPVASLIADVPAGIVAVINQALRKQPNQRPPSVSAFIVDLEDALNRPHAIPAGTRVFSAPLRRPLLPLQPPRIADPPDHHRVIGIGIVVMLVAAMGLMLASRYFH